MLHEYLEHMYAYQHTNAKACLKIRETEIYFTDFLRQQNKIFILVSILNGFNARLRYLK